ADSYTFDVMPLLAPMLRPLRKRPQMVNVKSTTKRSGDASVRGVRSGNRSTGGRASQLCSLSERIGFDG
ncbi:MAG TPA: hypothetical protein PKI77_18830, partial [Mycobacterium sp.]|nr:hypothetical protein [Mycobacterium sp.]